jgi:DNA-binding response OmpR family regulator
MIKAILIVEDDRFIGEMYVRSLKHEGYEVDWMVDGNDGLVAATNKQYDLILLDVMLPENARGRRSCTHYEAKVKTWFLTVVLLYSQILIKMKNHVLLCNIMLTHI